MTETLSYYHNTNRSLWAYQEAEKNIPGGVQGNIKFYEPYPLSFKSASGAWLQDVDGNHYVDYLQSFGALILGHGHSVVKQAVAEVWDTFGTSSFGVPYTLELTMTEKIKSLYPSMQQLRFTNSGLEATLLAIRLGMAYSGKPSIAKFYGHYHGGHEQVLVSTHSVASDVLPPGKTVESMGIPDYFLQHTEVLPFNNLDYCEQVLREKRDEIGVVVLEPLQGGYLPASPEFMQGLRELTKELGMVLVFDEVKTGFRTRLGGAQEFYQVQPDLTALGKVLGGGFPIGAVGGNKDILFLASPKRSRTADEVVFHSGTFNGNPVSLLAGLRTIEFLQAAGNYEKLLETTDNLRHQLEEVSNSYGLPVRTVGAGTIFNLVFSTESVRANPPSQQKDSEFDPAIAENSQRHKELRGKLDFLLMGNGVFSKPYNRFSLTMAHDAQAIQHTVDAFERSISALKQQVSGAYSQSWAI